ncbi:unnamed protein product [Brassica oleracea]
MKPVTCSLVRNHRRRLSLRLCFRSPTVRQVYNPSSPGGHSRAVASRLPQRLQFGGSSSSVVLSSVPSPPRQPSVNQTRGRSDLSNLDETYS